MIKKYLTITIRLVVLVAMVTFVNSNISYAGNLTPPGTPANTMYTLTDIFNLSSGATTTLGSGTIPTTSSSILATFKTLAEIYDAISAQVANLSNAKIANGISAFGFTGTLFGDTSAAKVLTSATYPGTIPVKTGDSAVVTTSTSSNTLLLTPPLGYYDGVVTVSTTSMDFIAGNIRSGTTIFGILGTLVSYIYGDNNQANVLTTATSPGTYDATNLSASTVKKGTVFGAGLTGTLYPAAELKTNQTICYDTVGSVVACAGTGQDGAYLKGVVRSYTDPVNGTITDNSTGLTWKKCSEGLSGTSCTTGTIALYTWTNALLQCEADTTAGQTDWRLPNVYELYSLVDFGVAAGPFINSTYFPATQSSYYWSGTSYPVNYSYAMGVAFQNGSAFSDAKTLSYNVRCVRG